MRGKQATPRTLIPDPVYQSELVTKFINYFMKHGKKSTSRAVVYGALENLGKSVKADPLDAFKQALNNITPKLEVRSRRVGGANYQVPMTVSPHRGMILSLRWLREAVHERTGKDSISILSEELVSAYNNQGTAVKKRENVEKMAEANRAFAQFRW